MISAPTGWEDFYIGSSSFDIRITVYLKNGVMFYLYKNNIDMGSLSLDDEISTPGDLLPGSVISQVLRFTIVNDANAFSNIDFKDARLHISFYVPGEEDIYMNCVYKGTFYVDSSEKNGMKIEITAYDDLQSMSDVLPDGYETYSKASWLLSDLIENAHHGTTLYYGDMPNKDYEFGTHTVGTDIPSGITRRELAQYVCECCGCYVRKRIVDTDTDDAVAVGFQKYDYTDDLDGGDFTFEGSPSVPAIVGQVIVGEFIVGTETTEDDADGGLFLAPFASNYTEITQGEHTIASYGISLTWEGDNNKVSFMYSNSTASPISVVVNQSMNLPVGMYRFAVEKTNSNSLNAIDSIVLTNTTTNTRYTATEGGVTFYNNSATDNYTIRIVFKGNMNLQINAVNIYLTDNAWMGASALQNVWQQTEEIDGGYFGFWGITNPTVYALPKLVYIPTASERRSITKVRIEGSGFDPVIVGSDEGETFEIYNNPLIPDAATALTIANNVLSTLDGVTFHKFNATWAADPRWEAGDMVSFEDSNGNKVVTPCTGINYRHGQFSNIFCAD